MSSVALRASTRSVTGGGECCRRWRRSIRRARWVLVAIVAAGALIRLVWAVPGRAAGGAAGPVLYLVLSDHIAAGDGYTYGPRPDQGATAYYPPGYPVAAGRGDLAGAAACPGDWTAFGVAVGLNVVLSVATIGLMFVLARRLAGPTAGLVAAGIWALWPNLVFHSAIVLTETLFLFLLVLLLIVTLADPAAARAPGRARLVAIGVLFGLCVLVRPVSLVAAPAFLVLWWGPGAAPGGVAGRAGGRGVRWSCCCRGRSARRW